MQPSSGSENLMEPNQMYLSENQKTVSHFFFCAFLKST